MTPDRWQQIQALFFALVDLPPEAQQARLEALQAQDPLLAEELQALLLADSQTLPLLDDTPWFGVTSDDPLPERLGTYRPIRLLGQGGMGLVYLAERADGAFEQQVALKVVRPDLLDRTFIRRFLQERQILAQLNHPGIARLLDGGALPDGRPFLAMEYVDGTPIDRYCDDHRLSIAARIRLFDQVLEAVAYAHRHLVVHRDLKPSNILVTDQEGKPRIKLLDFGIARLLDAETPTLTRTEQRLFTPAYAAPEQLSGRPITTATDVYALGTVLYRLLTGHLPSKGPFLSLWLRFWSENRSVPPAS
ncbi:serine/threonine-protein kinase [Rhodothermus marinus]|uniref:serine/threonine-protein kinase n=1 Tax=Rhodothermus marinus TaxID=29549 RepID=UPI0006D24AC1|nr:serine/threonine-protein kinase [Rhodothermus marinus]